MKKNPTVTTKQNICKFLLNQFKLLLLAALAITSNSYAASDFLWAKQGQFYFNGYGVALAADPAGNVYSIGYFSGTTDFDPGAGIFNMTAVGKSDAFILKLDKDGNFVWVKQIGGSDDDNAVGVHADAAGNLYVCGIFKSNSIDIDPGAGTSTLVKSGTQDAYALKLDASGNFVWGKQFGGGTSECNVYSMATDGTGNVVFGGYFSGTADFDPGSAVSSMTSKSADYDGFICKLTNTGAFAWCKQFEGDNFNGVSNIAADASGNVYATGIFEELMDSDPGVSVKNLATAGAVDVFVIKLDASGNFVWSAQGGGTEPDWARGIAVDATGNVFVTGTFDGKANFDPAGAGYHLTSVGGTWSPDAFVLKLNAAGKFSWVKQAGTISPEEVSGIALDAAGNIYITGSFTGVMDVDPGPAATYLTSTNDIDMFIWKLDASGNLVWAKNTVENTVLGRSKGCSIAVDGAQNVYTIGKFDGSVDFDPGTGKFDMNSSDGSEFIFKIGTKSGSAIAEKKAGNELMVVPNPFNEKCIIHSTVPMKNGLIIVRNVLGQVVQKHSNISGNSFETDLSHHPSGTYILELHSSERIATTKIIKE
ncbi:MAG: SBBP repeat-containing protein [Chitinophagaceae bacterium]|jgi:hypothetical protein